MCPFELFVSRLEANEFLRLTPFEKNLDIWRQLWRVLERSHVVRRLASCAVDMIGGQMRSLDICRQLWRVLEGSHVERRLMVSRGLSLKR